MNREQALLRRIRVLTSLFILGLVLSGLTAIPLPSEVDWLAKSTGARQRVQSAGSAASWAAWLIRVQTALNDVATTQPFLFYGTDWLAFGHFIIALAFLGALRDPVRNSWLFDYGVIACGLVIPYALVFGAIRGVPLWWRLIDCSFGVFGIVPMWICRRWTMALQNLART